MNSEVAVQCGGFTLATHGACRGGVSHELARQVFYRRKLGGSAILADAAFAVAKDHIQSGRFTRDWMLENQLNQTSFKAMRAKAAALPIEEVGARPRALVLRIGAHKLVDKDKN